MSDLADDSAVELGWLNGWRRSSHGFVLEAFVRDGTGWSTKLLPASSLLQQHRAFEPSLHPFSRLSSRNFRLRIPDLSSLSPLLEPGRFVAQVVPPARRSRHAVYAHANEEGTVYIPAALLLRELWLWFGSAVDALMTPNGLALYLSSAKTTEGLQVEVSGPLRPARNSDEALRRLSWLAQCRDAQASWSSVLSYAHADDLRLRLPSASLEAWAWGVDLPAGTLVAELSAVAVRFDLPVEGTWVLVGTVRRRCPVPIQRRSGLVSF